MQWAPSLPMKGEVLTPKVMRTVGSLMSMDGRAFGLSKEAMVSPMDTPSGPVTATMSPVWASETSTRSIPRNTNMRSTTWEVSSASRPNRATSSRSLSVPLVIRPMATCPR